MKEIIKFLILILLFTNCSSLGKGFQSIKCSLNTECSLSKLEPEIKKEIKEVEEKVEKRYKPDSKYIRLQGDDFYDSEEDFYVLANCPKLLKVISGDNNGRPNRYVSFLFPETKGNTFRQEKYVPLYYKRLTGREPNIYVKLEKEINRATSDWSLILKEYDPFKDTTEYITYNNNSLIAPKNYIDLDYSLTLFKFKEKKGQFFPYLDYYWEDSTEKVLYKLKKVSFFSRDGKNRVTVNVKKVKGSYRSSLFGVIIEANEDAKIPLSDKQIKGINKIFRNEKYITIRLQFANDIFDFEIINHDLFIQDSLSGKVDFKYTGFDYNDYKSTFSEYDNREEINQLYSLISTVTLIDYYFKLKKGKIK